MEVENTTPQTHSIPAWKLEKQEAKAAKLKAKVTKFELDLQFESLTNQGFSNGQKVFRALKKSKGDVAAAANLLKSTDSTDEDRKCWKKYLKNRTPSQEAQRQEEKKSRKCKGRTPSEEARKLERKMEKLSAGDSKPRRSGKHERTPEEEQIRQDKKHANAMNRMQDRQPEFEAFNAKMIALGFTNPKKNFNALKKKEGNQETAALHLKFKKHLENLELCNSLEQKKFTTIYLDCNNFFYLEPAFLKQATSGQYRIIEEKIATLVKLFQEKYVSKIVLVFDNSTLVSEKEAIAKYVSSTFEMITARPKFASADDLLVSIATSASDNNDSLYVTSDRMLQARLVDVNVQNIMGSKMFFNALKKDFIGKLEYAAIIEA